MTDGAESSWGGALIIAFVGKCAESLVGAALLPARRQEKKMKGACVRACVEGRPSSLKAKASGCGALQRTSLISLVKNPLWVR